MTMPSIIHPNADQTENSTTHTSTHGQHHIPLQSTHKTHTDTTHITTSTVAHKFSHAYQKHYHITNLPMYSDNTTIHFHTTQIATISQPKPYTATTHTSTQQPILQLMENTIYHFNQPIKPTQTLHT